jgi:YHS domain-containing protein
MHPADVHPLQTDKEDDVNEQLMTDPVCGMKILPADAAATIDHEGTTYYFCSQDCADSFKESPEDYV